jgi:hypothetical protein
MWEQYFSDFLSCLESEEPLQLHSEPEIESGANEEEIAIPQKLFIPKNVFFTGTVNVDETTYMFSPKVLDRAFTIELQTVDLEGFGRTIGANMPGELTLKSIPALHVPKKPDASDWNDFAQMADGQLRNVLVRLNEILAPNGLHFGYRVANEIARFVLLAGKHNNESSDALWAALDLAILEKVLPKFHGTQQELDEPLRAFFAFSQTAAPPSDVPSWDAIRLEWRAAMQRLEPVGKTLADPKLPRVARKTWLMLQRLHQQGFTSFIA